MNWETPQLVEIRMDAEIGSYQEDFGGDEEPPTLGGARANALRRDELDLALRCGG